MVAQTKTTATKTGPYSQAVSAVGFLFCAGQIPLDPKTGEMVTGGIEATTVFAAGLARNAPVEIELAAREKK